MQKCMKCNNKLGYKNKMGSFLWGYSPIICEGCGSKYYVRWSTRIIYACLISLPVILLNHFVSLDHDNKLWGYLIWILLVVLVMPFWAGYYRKDDGDSGE